MKLEEAHALINLKQPLRCNHFLGRASRRLVVCLVVLGSALVSTALVSSALVSTAFVSTFVQCGTARLALLVCWRAIILLVTHIDQYRPHFLFLKRTGCA